MNQHRHKRRSSLSAFFYHPSIVHVVTIIIPVGFVSCFPPSFFVVTECVICIFILTEGKRSFIFLLGKGGEGVQLSMNHSSTPNRRKCPRQLIQMNYLSFSKALLVIFFIASPPAEMFTAVLNVATGCRLSTPVSDRWRHPKSRPPSRLKSADRALWVSHLVLMQLTNRDVSSPRRWRHRLLPTPLPTPGSTVFSDR